MSDDRLLFELSDGIAILTLNRPEVMNAFEDGMREALFERLEECAENRDVRCVVITGAAAPSRPAAISPAWRSSRKKTIYRLWKRA